MRQNILDDMITCNELAWVNQAAHVPEAVRQICQALTRVAIQA